MGRVAIYISLLPLIAARYGTSNLAGQLGIVLRVMSPDFAAGDQFLDTQAQPGQPRFYYAWVLSKLTALMPLNISAHVVQVVSHFGLGWGIFSVAMRLPAMTRPGALIAALLGTTSVGIHLGGAG